MSLTHPEGTEVVPGPAGEVPVAPHPEALEPAPRSDDEVRSGRRISLPLAAGGVALVLAGGWATLRGGGESDPAQQDGTELASGDDIDSLSAASDTATDGFDFRDFEGGRRLTTGEINQIASGLGFSDEITERFASSSLGTIAAEQSLLDDLMAGGVVPFVEIGGQNGPANWRVFDSGLVNPAQDPSSREVFAFNTVDPGQRMDLEGNLYSVEGADAVFLGDAIDRAGGQQSTEVAGTQETATQEATAVEAPEADMTPEQLLGLPIEQTELLQPAERAELARAAYEQATGNSALVDIVMTPDTPQDFYNASAQRILAAAADSGDPRILWAIYSSIDDPRYRVLADDLANGSTGALSAESSAINIASSFDIDTATGSGTVTVKGEERTIYWNGAFWQFQP